MRPVLTPPSGPPAAGAIKPAPAESSGLKDQLLSEVRKSSPVMYNTFIIQARRLDVSGDRVVLTFEAAQKIGPTFDKYRPVLESLASKLAGRKMTVVAETAGDTGSGPGAGQAEADRKSALKAQALADAGVQAMLEVFPAEIRDVEEM